MVICGQGDKVIHFQLIRHIYSPVASCVPSSLEVAGLSASSVKYRKENKRTHGNTWLKIMNIPLHSS